MHTINVVGYKQVEVTLDDGRKGIAIVPIPFPCNICGEDSEYGEEEKWYCSPCWQRKFIKEHIK